jgi:DNA-binding MarR family transcriptional regulator
MQAIPGTLNGTERGAWRGFVRAHALLWKELDGELERLYGLPLSSFEVLVQLSEADEGRMRMNELAEAVALSRSGLCRLIDRLARGGLIERSPCPDDARGAFAVITDLGLRRLHEVSPAYVQTVRGDFLAHFDDADLARLAEYWRRLLNGTKI